MKEKIDKKFYYKYCKYCAYLSEKMCSKIKCEKLEKYNENRKNKYS